jgi:hypothetical protein
MQGAAIPHEVPGVVPAPGRDTHVSPYAAGPIPASAGDPSGAAPRGVSGTDYQGVSSQTRSAGRVHAGPCSAETFWEDVNAGRIRLSRWEDQFVWDCRAAGAWWSHIAQAILERRARRREIVAKARKGRERARVLRWREEYRVEKREKREQAAR